MSDFPTSLPSFTNLDGNLTLAANSHAGRHNKVHDEIAAVAAKVGIDSSADTDSLDYKSAQAASHASNTSNPHSVTKSQVGLSNVDNTSDATKLAATLLAVYPVGSIYISVSSTDPGTLFGGTWIAYAEGRVVVGKAAAGTFQTAGATGGAETHTLTEAELPVMDKPLRRDLTGVPVGIGGSSTSGNSLTGTFSPVSVFANSIGIKIGSGNSHNNLQPYIVTYMFRRTA